MIPISKVKYAEQLLMDLATVLGLFKEVSIDTQQYGPIRSTNIHLESVPDNDDADEIEGE